MAQVNDLIVTNNAKFMGAVSVPPDITILDEAALFQGSTISMAAIPEKYKYITFKLYGNNVLISIIQLPLFEWYATGSNNYIMFTQTFDGNNSAYKISFYRTESGSIYVSNLGYSFQIPFSLSATVNMII